MFVWQIFSVRLVKLTYKQVSKHIMNFMCFCLYLINVTWLFQTLRSFLSFYPVITSVLDYFYCILITFNATVASQPVFVHLWYFLVVFTPCIRLYDAILSKYDAVICCSTSFYHKLIVIIFICTADKMRQPNRVFL